MEGRYGKPRYKIREAAEIIGVPQSTLRFWEQEFPDLKPKRSSHNQRYYTPTDLELLEIIFYLLHTKGLKIEAAKEYLRLNRHNLSRRMEVIDKLKGLRQELEGLLKALSLRGNQTDKLEL